MSVVENYYRMGELDREKQNRHRAIDSSSIALTPSNTFTMTKTDKPKHAEASQTG